MEVRLRDPEESNTSFGGHETTLVVISLMKTPPGLTAGALPVYGVEELVYTWVGKYSCTLVWGGTRVQMGGEVLMWHWAIREQVIQVKTHGAATPTLELLGHLP